MFLILFIFKFLLTITAITAITATTGPSPLPLPQREGREMRDTPFWLVYEFTSLQVDVFSCAFR